MGLIEYEQIKNVVNMHNAPRFGHSSSIALLASHSQDEQADYAQGVKAFCIFNLIIICVWVVVLSVLKILGPSKVGCAAGGHVLDHAVLKKKYDRPTRNKIENRSWRVQTAFSIATALLFIACGLFLGKGLLPVGNSLENVSDINHSIERLFTEAFDVTQSLKREQSRIHSVNVQALLHLDTFCPNAVEKTEWQAINISSIGETFRSSAQELDSFMDFYVADAQNGLRQLQDASESLDDTMTWFQEKEWILRFLILILLVVNLFLLVGLILSRNNIAFNPYTCLLVYFLVPVFFVCLVLSAVATYGFGGAAVMNAGTKQFGSVESIVNLVLMRLVVDPLILDFCAGGAYPGSPEGTIEDIFVNQGASKNKSLVYQSFVYYMDGCSSENPFAFLSDFEPKIQSAIDGAEMFSGTAEAHGASTLSESCGVDIFPVVSAATVLINALQSIQNELATAIDLSSCHSIAPILRRIFYGTICNESVSGFTWMFSCCLAISFLGLTMLSARAAMYNATLRPPRKPRSRRQIQREFKEYKDFMAQFYGGEVDEWELHPKKKELRESCSYDTEITAVPSNYTDTTGDEMPFDEYSDDDSDVGVFTTPHKRMDSIQFSRQTRDRLHVLDGEMEPLSPVLTVTHLSPPPAPKKRITKFQRTSLGMPL